MGLKHLFKAVTTEEERALSKEAVGSARERYLETNPLARYRNDEAYALKVDLIRNGLRRGGSSLPAGWVLDIGGSTAGEATVLAQEGIKFVVGDINESALDVSRERVRKFGLCEPGYVGMDVHQLPFADNSFHCVTMIEAFHHFPDHERALKEIYRVLRPGGLLYAQEPNGLDPLRKLSEIRDRMRGIHETSYSRRCLLRLFRRAGFERTIVAPGAHGRSSWKLEEIPMYRRWLTHFHSFLQKRWPVVFRSVQITAYKAGVSCGDIGEAKWQDLLRQPGGGAEVEFDSSIGRWRVRGSERTFPDLSGVPVLVVADATF
jgi:ubiquinone/menaquinone biosynthesis C-methylase UbiE